jgi:hypothetical protein
MTSSRDACIAAEALMPLIQERLAAGQRVRGLRFQGISMLPLLRQGKDSVELTALPDRLRTYDLPLYRAPSGKYVMHRIVAVEPDHYVCLGDNTYAFEHVRPEQMVALVAAIQRGKKRISVDSPAYRAYCRVWCWIIPLRRFLKRVEFWLRRRLQ